MSGCLEHVSRIGTVSGDAAVHAHLFERDPLLIIGKNHCQAGRAALQRLHLHDDRDFGYAFFDRFFDLFTVITHS